MRGGILLGSVMLLTGWSACGILCAQSPEAAKIANEFFETTIRPILVERCHGCHGPKKQEGGLRLDSAEGLRKGSDSGAVIVAGKPEESLLVEAIRYDGDLKMPPKGKLPEKEIAALTAWVRAGAHWPQSIAEKSTRTPKEAARTHWAFQPVRRPVVPAVRDAAWVRTPVDAFILAKLEAAGLRPSPQADRRTLLRRVTFDLIGLPPTPDEVQDFEADTSPDAFARVVDRLLASPRYGERWGRHWLDVARYADTKGYVRLNENPRYVCGWTYRDYVIRAFNEDLPYDEFIVQQIAADQLDLKGDPRSLAAMGFLTLGQRFINSQHDIIDDRIDVVTRGLMGLTVSCARCHDHKFDPIPTQDYYSLHGVFAGSVEPRVPPLIVAAVDRDRHQSYLVELQKRQGALDEFLRTEQSQLTTACRARAAEYMLAGQREQVQANFLAVMFLVDVTKDLNPVMVQRWARLFEQTRKRQHPVLQPWHDLAALFAGQRTASEVASKLDELIVTWRATERRVNPVVVEALATDRPKELADAARTYASLLQNAEDRWLRLAKSQPNAERLEDPDWEEIRRLLYGENAPLWISVDDVEEFLFVDTTKQNQFHAQQRQIEDWIGSPDAAPHAMSLHDAASPAAARVFIRGNASNPGEVVPRRFLEVLADGERRPFGVGSGRLELAKAIANRDNPLTARVFVNRVWMQHFGAGLVRTPGDFGLRGEPPTHPELLDYLAASFMDEGWSLKTLHRLIVLSATYQQSSGNTHSVTLETDPENLLWGRMNRRRLDWEPMRDSLLAVSGRLEPRAGGPAVDLFSEPFSARRSVYGFIDRQNLASALRTFDFAPPDASSPQRHQTTVPQQALFLMNSPFLAEQARAVASRAELSESAPLRERIDRAYRLLFGRPARLEEIADGEQYLASAQPQPADVPPNGLAPWEEYLQALLLSNEFVFVD